MVYCYNQGLQKRSTCALLLHYLDPQHSLVLWLPMIIRVATKLRSAQIVVFDIEFTALKESADLSPVEHLRDEEDVQPTNLQQL